MRGRQLVLFCALAALIVAAAVSGSFRALPSFSRSDSTPFRPEPGVPSFSSRPSFDVAPLVEPASGSAGPFSHDPHSGPSLPELDFGADPFSIPEPGSLSAGESSPRPLPPVAAQAPQKLSVPPEAAPIDLSRDDALLDVITEELPGLSDEDRRVWLEQLRDLPLSSVREMLRLRKDLGSTFRIDRPVLGPEDDKPAPRVSLTETPDVPARISIASLRHAAEILLNNVANAQTAGFKRTRVAFRDLPGHFLAFTGDGNGLASPGTSVAVGGGVRLGATELDLTQGALSTSSDPLDIAIDGDGFFQVSDGAHVLFTRRGELTIAGDGRLALACDEALLFLTPEVRISREAAAIRIHPDGVVSIQSGETSDWTAVGNIQLARFRNPAVLIPQGNSLLAAADETGAPQAGSPGGGGRGRLKQYALEGSNVDLEREARELEQLQQQLEILTRFARLGPEQNEELPLVRRTADPGARSLDPGNVAPAMAHVRRWLEQISGLIQARFAESPSPSSR